MSNPNISKDNNTIANNIDNNNNSNSINNNNDIFNQYEEIKEIEEIDKEKLKAEIDQEMSIENDDNNNENNNDLDNEINDNFIEDENVIEEEYHKEYPDFQAQGEIYAIAFHKKSGTLIIGDGEDTTYFYDLDKKKVIKSEKYNKDSVSFVKISEDEKYVLTASIDGSLNIFDSTKNFSLVAKITDQVEEINWIEWHPKGPCFAFGTADGSVWVYMANNIKNNFYFYSHTKASTCGSFVEEGKKLISGGEDGTLRVYNLRDKELEKTIKRNKSNKFIQGPISCLTVSESKSSVAIGTLSNEICILNYKTENILISIKVGAEEEININNVLFCHNDNYLVFTDSSNKITVYDINTQSTRASTIVEGGDITKIIRSNKHNYEIYCSGTNGIMYVFDTRSNISMVFSEKAHNYIINDFIVTKDEDFIITSSLDKTINLIRLVDIKNK